MMISPTYSTLTHPYAKKDAVGKNQLLDYEEFKKQAAGATMLSTVISLTMSPLLSSPKFVELKDAGTPQMSQGVHFKDFSQVQRLLREATLLIVNRAVNKILEDIDVKISLTLGKFTWSLFVYDLNGAPYCDLILGTEEGSPAGKDFTRLLSKTIMTEARDALKDLAPVLRALIIDGTRVLNGRSVSSIL